MMMNLQNLGRRWLIAPALLCAVTVMFAADTMQLPPLTTASGNPRLPGKFVWGDLITDNVPAARKFYSQLFGWTFRDMGNYLIAENDERPLCGILHRDRPQGTKARPRWFGYLSVSDVARAQKAVLDGGGKVVAAPKNLPNRGEQAVFTDAEGALFSVIKSTTGDPEDFLPDVGDWMWIQLVSRNAQKAGEFYNKVAGYEVIANTSSNRTSDYVLASKGYARATIRTVTNMDVKPNWMPFVRVKSVQESIALAKQLGGKLVFEARDGVFDGKAAIVSDPTGAAIGIMEWQEGLLKGGQ